MIEVRDNDNYVLSLPPALKIHPVFHVDRLSPYSGNNINGLLPPPPDPITVNGEEEYEVEKILDSRFYRNQFQCLVHWKGYDNGHNSWEPAKNLGNAQQKVKEFHREYPSAPRIMSTTSFEGVIWRPLENMTDTTPSDLEWRTGRRTGLEVSRTTRS